MFLGPEIPMRPSRGPRRLPRDTQRDTQRWSKNWSKRGQQVHPKMSKNKRFDIQKKSLWPASAGPFLRPRKGHEKKQQKNEWSNLGMLFEQFWEFFGAHFGTRSAKEGARWAQESHQDFKEPKSCIFKKLKKPSVFSVFGSKGLPRELQEAREGSQETPKETPKGGPNIGQTVVK